VSNERPLWACKACGRTFANPKQTHTCAALGYVDVQNAEFAAQLAEAYPSARRSTARRRSAPRARPMIAGSACPSRSIAVCARRRLIRPQQTPANDDLSDSCLYSIL